jgi:hypothetical protein
MKTYYKEKRKKEIKIIKVKLERVSKKVENKN